MKAHSLVAGATITLGAFLLFLLEPLASKELLPLLGGSSAVWLTCLCFFQVVLLLGYGYAALLSRPGWQHRAPMLHLSALLLAALWVCIAFRTPVAALSAAGHAPALTIFLLLGNRIGLPFFLLSATSPLLQVWLAHLDREGVRFRLFALSNAGSLFALVAFPTLFEPFLPLHTQRLLWIGGFCLYAVLCGSVAVLVRQRALPPPSRLPVEPCPSSSPARRLLCFFLAMAGALQLCAVTSHLTENIASIPLLWILPLGVYLVSFILAFEAPSLYRRPFVLRLLVVFLASLGYLLSKTDVSLPIGVSILFFLVELFLACWFCHTELFHLRPRTPSQAASFYLLVAAGGAAGTFVAAILAPMLFNANYDLPLAFAATALAASLITWREGWSRRLLWGTATLLCLVLIDRLHVAYARDSLFMARNFYGSLRVKQTDLPPQAGGSRLLLHGTIEHGMQWFAPEFLRQPLTYYGHDSGAGVALSLCCGSRPRSIGVIGLGAGTLATYGRAGDRLRFYELNPLVEDVAHTLFAYLRDSPATISIVTGDARQSLAREPDQNFDVLVVDAFSGDAIPVHLLTLQALQLYLRHLRPTGVLAFHISNQYLDLAPALQSTTQTAGLQARVIDSPGDAATGIFAARWILVGRPASVLFASPDRTIGSPLAPSLLRPWTDDFSSLLPLVRWSGQAR